ncbi:ATP-binding protein [Burkholderia cepacia]|uniref:ATP-binding protein n=1 Tax=Burkholderia cepacia TaxID=292 RepID=UPI001ABB0F26|nr:ATP-binding protein [Burkholderia cepacia]
MRNTAKAFPAKRFFVDMLTRDIELQDAILDLLDNCVDGAMRLNKGKRVDTKHPYRGYAAHIEFDGKKFSVSDNCGGIPRNIAEDYAFRMGRPDSSRDPDLPTVGVYGIGMKRAIFKMGRAATVTSLTASDESFQVLIDDAWLSDDENWDLPIEAVSDCLDKPGTIIEVTSLKDGVARLLSNDTDFHKELEKAIAAYYGYIIEKGFNVRLNGREIKPVQVSLLFDRDSFGLSEGIIPYVYSLQHEGVSVDLAVGLYRELPTDVEEDDALEGRPSTERAGWTVICNDRVVLHADKTRVTGWGEAGVPSYHTQFVSIAGVVVFRSNDPSKLPITTTKRGIDGNSELYLGVKEHMRDGLKVFTDFTNKWKKSTPERSEIRQKATSVSAEFIASLVPKNEFSKVTKGLGGSRFRPSLPMPKETDPIKQIRFSRRYSEIRKVAEYLFEDPNTPIADVGAQCFDDVLRKVKK